MKKQLRKLPLVASLFLLFSMSCSKQEDPVVIEESAIFTLVISEFTPGDSVEIKSNKALLSSDIDVVLNNTSIKAYKISDFSYIFTLPVIPSGKYDLKLPTINKDLILNLTVKTYTPIANPTEVIAGYVLTRNKCFDEMSKNTSVVPFKTSPETLQMIDQIKQEWDFQFNKSSAKEKELLAYVLQKQEISADWFNFPNDVPASYFAKTNGVQNDVGDKLVTYAKTYITAQVVCVKSIPATVGTATVFLIAPNPITAGLFLISFTTFIVSREVAERNAVAVGSLKGVAEAVTDFSFQKTAALELVNNFEKNITMSVNFRNLKSTDAAIQSDISTAFTGENELVAKDNEVKVLYQKATSFTEKLKGLFSSYTPAIGKTSERSLTSVVLGSDIIIKGSSDANVTITSKMVGTNQVIKASSTSTTDINFNLKVAYKRKIDGQEVVKDIACVYKPTSPSVSLVGNWIIVGYGSGSYDKSTGLYSSYVSSETFTNTCSSFNVYTGNHTETFNFSKNVVFTVNGFSMSYSKQTSGQFCDASWGESQCTYKYDYNYSATLPSTPTIQLNNLKQFSDKESNQISETCTPYYSKGTQTCTTIGNPYCEGYSLNKTDIGNSSIRIDIKEDVNTIYISDGRKQFKLIRQ